ncbi:hypothetical protein C9J85_01260 [Haloferax sp. wsp5]|nr:hypothetical protein C9J85_01260 [Haloferax sp. wsp5]
MSLSSMPTGTVSRDGAGSRTFIKSPHSSYNRRTHPGTQMDRIEYIQRMMDGAPITNRMHE